MTTRPDTDKKIVVYLIEDEEDLQEALVYSLNQLGFAASGFSTASEFYRAYAVSRCDIVVIDIELPDENGFSIAQHLRSASNVGIVFATARGELNDRVRGLRGGADAYFVKPVHAEELAATLEGVYRRIKASKSSAERGQPPAAPRGTGRWTLKEGDWILCDPDGRGLRLTMSERAIVACLFKQRNKPVDRSQLATALGGDLENFDLQRVDAVVSRLRRKALAAGMSLPLHAVRGTGYQFQA
ncbi:DNA-binding response regulator, OmpR family, contains REC and winged-helix (wHTH) domain [Variovorax sp. YR266]|uniref:response regulator transcription factor n=1 Tax=Variovorax sp. YR266 TaxID=1884386 RepID=UPI0008976C3A|nr:response regulator transcription factor [Variovorax sp. YR266]SDZ68520.1 DNA-binding response regulator, OmpR family, contains REC and winged-helix (wHTH) domain [Variovorax sp. YR266]